MEIQTGKRIFVGIVAALSIGIASHTAYQAAQRINALQADTDSMNTTISYLTRLQTDDILMSLNSKGSQWHTGQNAHTIADFTRTLHSLSAENPARMHTQLDAIQSAWLVTSLIRIPTYSRFAHHKYASMTRMSSDVRGRGLASLQMLLVQYLAGIQSIQHAEQKQLNELTEHYIYDSLITPLIAIVFFQIIVFLLIGLLERRATLLDATSPPLPFLEKISILGEQQAATTNSSSALPESINASSVNILGTVLDESPPSANNNHEVDKTPDLIHSTIENTAATFARVVKSSHGFTERLTDAKNAAQAALAAVTHEEEHLRRHFVAEHDAIKVTISRVREHAQELHTGSHQMSSILSSVDDIVNQMSLLATRARVKAVAAGDTGKAMAIINDAVVKLSAQCVHHSKSLTTLVEHFRKEAEHALTHADASASAITDNSAMALQSAVQMDSVRSDVQALVTELEKSAEIADKNAAEAKLAEVEILSTSSLGIKLPLTLPNDPALRNEPESKVSSNRE